ncbi:barstar family protein [Streptomyces rubiginosohelvolus]|uniref:barstar family protein n=1 Tax=Streptomyces rubiginosohelvolus TaxID=67362 RepID=UPI003625371A
MVIGRGLHELSGTDVSAIRGEAARRGIPVLTLSTAGRTDKEAFFTAVRNALPLDPPLGTFRRVWDALADSVWGGLHELKSPRVIIVWPDTRPVAGAERDFRTALSILRDVAASLADDRDTGGRPTQVSVYVASVPSCGEAASAKG